MSQGLGALQREILATLDAAQAPNGRYNGCVVAWNAGRKRVEPVPGWAKVRGVVVRLAEGVYDLRASARYLSEKHGARYGPYDDYVTKGFQASFARAVRSLIQRGVLRNISERVPITDVWVDHEPLDDPYEHPLVSDTTYLYDGTGMVFDANLRQVRFVVRA
jgi:hypothetical protein